MRLQLADFPKLFVLLIFLLNLACNSHDQPKIVPVKPKPPLAKLDLRKIGTPTKIKFIVYTGPGGLLDQTTQAISSIMQRLEPNLEIEVVNKTDGGGLLALSYLLGHDEHSLEIPVLAMTDSLLDRVFYAKQDGLLKNFAWFIKLSEDYQCIITRKNSKYASLKSLDDSQVWLGPANNGSDHRLAKALWQQLDIRPRWIQYPSGKEALAALAENRGDLYVGNPGDVYRDKRFEILAVASQARLKSLASVPTLRELGFLALKESSVWRGFALAKSTDAKTRQYVEKLFLKVVNDEAWLRFLKKRAITAKIEIGETPKHLAKLLSPSKKPFSDQFALE